MPPAAEANSCQAEAKWREELSKAEIELEERQKQHEKELGDVTTRSEESLQQLKQFYEQEKQGLEGRLREERR